MTYQVIDFFGETKDQELSELRGLVSLPFSPAFFGPGEEVLGSHMDVGPGVQQTWVPIFVPFLTSSVLHQWPSLSKTEGQVQ